ncbi:VOC family protein [Candidatus Kaiserbacteria bacterium]|nr:VOC family protein [Candidatus Kaiserbacteria bacterium]USN89187.1 MAG: VOC family protein [Candidatus Nomurabacteria bacterium]
MKQKLSLVTLGVSDLMAARTFYEDVLGFEPAPESSESVAFYDMQGTWLGLYLADALAEDAQVAPESDGFRQVTLAHNESSREAVDSLFDDLRNQGVEIVKEPQETSWGGYSGYFADIDGHLWEVAYNPFMDLT